MMKKPHIAALLMVLIATSAFASPISSRRESFKNIKHTMTPMAQMLNSGSFNPSQFAQAAAQLDNLSKEPWQYFPAGSDNMDTRADIWSKPAEFKQAQLRFVNAAGKLHQLAASADVNALRAQFRLVQQSCKACHDSFRN
jgi:cytochrome c556